MKSFKNHLLIASVLLTIVSNSYSLTDAQRKFITLIENTDKYARTPQTAITLVHKELPDISQQGLSNLNFTFEVDRYFDDPRYENGKQIKTSTPLIHAYLVGYPDADFLHYLLTLGLNPLFPNQEGLTPLELAELYYKDSPIPIHKAIRDLFRDWIQHKEKRKIFKK